MEKWPQIARERINKFVQKKFWYPGAGRSPIYHEQEIYEEYAGHLLLRLVAAEDPRVQGWLVEQEGDLFELRFRRVSTTETKFDIAKYLFGDENVLEPNQLWLKFDINNRLFSEFKLKNRKTAAMAVHFTCVPRMVSNRSALLKDGFVVALIDDFTMAMKTTFEYLLRERIRETKEAVDRIARVSVQEPIIKLKEELSKIVHSTKKAKDRFELTDYKLFTKENVYPQCMRDLSYEFSRTGHLNHTERFQLGLFLKHIGMTVDEQLFFWFEKSVDNVGQTYDQFTSGPAGYQVRYIYGLEGGGTDYSAHKCETIQNQGYCTFLHQSIEQIEETIRDEYKNPNEYQIQLIQGLLRAVVDKRPGDACAAMFQLRYGRKARTIKHPVNYVRYAARVLKLILPMEEVGEDKEKKTKVTK
jgi:DNA primase large subunit